MDGRAMSKFRQNTPASAQAKVRQERPLAGRLPTIAAAALIFLATPAPHLPAFPPAPYYVLHGHVRDQTGQLLKVEGATLLLLKDSEVIDRAPIYSNLRIEQNYELKIRIDSAKGATRIYNRAALESGGQFSLAVEMGGDRYYPIEVSGSLSAGTGGERVRLDLNLGEDSDGDSLPDIWEQWQLFQAGYFPDSSGEWPIDLIDRDGDFDSDGSSNWLEYIAGTFAGDATESLDLKIVRRTATRVDFEFFAITGKTYTILRSTDLKSWQGVPFSTGESGEAKNSHTATGVGVQPASCTPGSPRREFYRLLVR